MTSVIPISRENNPSYPLPPDYDDLTVDGKRLARVNACRQWLLSGTPTEMGENLVWSTWFFDSYYLHPDPDDDFDPLFYDLPPVETPPFHWDISRTWGANRLNICLAPRGGAKSTHCRKDILLRLCSTPYSMVYATSSHDNAKHTGNVVRSQAYENRRIVDDFGVEGRLRPLRGEKPTGVEYFYLANGSWLRCLSAESRLRGLRPRRFRLDDPEYEERASTSMQVIRDYMQRLLFKVVLPMIMRPYCGADWIGTFVSKRHYLWHAMQVIQSPSGIRAQDPAFNHWARLWIRAVTEDPTTGQPRSCWPSMWPLTEKDRLASSTPGAVSLERMKEMMGASSFNHEMLGKPGTADEQFFHLDPDSRGRHAYWFENVDDSFATPRSSSAQICFNRVDSSGTSTTTRVPLSEWIPTVRLFMTVDTAYTEGSTSDRRVCTLMAIDSSNTLFVLDMWSDKKGDSVLLRYAMEICQAWKCPIIFVEVVKESIKLYQRFRSAVNTRVTADMGFTHIPAVRDLRPGMFEKTAKIATLDLRFEHGLIKLPIFRRFEKPWWTRLFDQIESFSPEADNGGLEKDDEIDTVAMSILIIKSKLLRTTPSPTVSLDPIAALRSGTTSLPDGSPILHGLPLSEVPADVINSLLCSSTAALTGVPTRV